MTQHHQGARRFKKRCMTNGAKKTAWALNANATPLQKATHGKRSLIAELSARTHAAIQNVSAWPTAKR